jgi:hypothetical protein
MPFVHLWHGLFASGHYFRRTKQDFHRMNEEPRARQLTGLLVLLWLNIKVPKRNPWQ